MDRERGTSVGETEVCRDRNFTVMTYMLHSGTEAGRDKIFSVVIGLPVWCHDLGFLGLDRGRLAG